MIDEVRYNWPRRNGKTSGLAYATVLADIERRHRENEERILRWQRRKRIAHVCLWGALLLIGVVGWMLF